MVAAISLVLQSDERRLATKRFILLNNNFTHSVIDLIGNYLDLDLTRTIKIWSNLLPERAVLTILPLETKAFAALGDEKTQSVPSFPAHNSED